MLDATYEETRRRSLHQSPEDLPSFRPFKYCFAAEDAEQIPADSWPSLLRLLRFSAPPKQTTLVHRTPAEILKLLKLESIQH